MSLFFNSDDGVHLDRLNAEQMGKRGIFINVRPAVNDNNRKERWERELVPPSRFNHRQHHLKNISAELRRDAAAKSATKKVNGAFSWRERVKSKKGWICDSKSFLKSKALSLQAFSVECTFCLI